MLEPLIEQRPSDHGRQSGHAVKAISVSYMSLPRKKQLAVLMLARFAEPLTVSSIQSYLFYQLKHIDPSATPETISAQAGLIFGLNTAAHVCTGLLWGRFADSGLGRRKLVLIVGLVASAIAIVGYGFATSFTAAIIWRIVDGALNSTVPMVRCITAEINPDKRYRARALTLLPLCANAGHLLGPLIGGFLVYSADGHGLGASLSKYPYALPNILVAGFHIIAALGAYFVLDEGIDGRSPPPEQNVRSHSVNDDQSGAHSTDRRPKLLGDRAVDRVDESTPLLVGTQHDEEAIVASNSPENHGGNASFRQVCDIHVFNTMLTLFIIAGHLGTFTSLWALFLSAPADTKHESGRNFHLEGGLGFDTKVVGTIMSLQAALGIVIQVLIYPALDDRFGTLRVFRVGLGIFPVAYILAPFCGVAGIQEALVWVGVVLVLLLYVLGRVSVSPATTLLINECTPHPRLRGTIHTLGTIVTSLSRSIFPPMAFAIFGRGLAVGLSGLGFWFIGALAVIACLASMRVAERG